jgi:hypothetical protein
MDEWRLDLKVNVPRITRLFSHFYDLMQTNRAVADGVHRLIFENRILTPVVTNLVGVSTAPELLHLRLDTIPELRRNRRMLWVTTHVVGGQSVEDLLSMSRFDDSHVNFSPDPWGTVLNSMIPIERNPGRSITVVYDEETAREARKLRPGQNIVSLGTLSHPEFVFGDKSKEVLLPEKPIHILVHASGKELWQFDRLVSELLPSLVPDILNGKLRLTLHAMQHVNTAAIWGGKLEELGLKANKNVRLIKENNMYEAVDRKIEELIGNSEWGRPDIGIVKGGEGPLENRGEMLTVCIFDTTNHEDRDITVGVAGNPGFVRDYRRIPIGKWWDTMRRDLANRPATNPNSLGNAFKAIEMVL